MKSWQVEEMPADHGAVIPDFLYGTAWKENRTPAPHRTGAPDGLPGNRHGQPAPALLRSRSRPGVGRRLPGGGRHARASCSCRPSSHIGQVRITGCRTTLRRIFPLKWPSRWPARSNISGPTMSTASSCMGLLPATAGLPMIHRFGMRWRGNAIQGRVRLLGVSNVSLRHLKQMTAVHSEAPSFVQNRCFARLGWDRDVRLFCGDRKIIYQGFSLLTANPEVLRHPLVDRPRFARQCHAGTGRVSLCPDGRNLASDRHLRRPAHDAGLGEL